MPRHDLDVIALHVPFVALIARRKGITVLIQPGKITILKKSILIMY